MAMFAPPQVLVKLLDLKQLLGCGHEGCVYATTRGTVVKVTEGRTTSEVSVAQALQPLFGKHRIVPRIYGFGEERELLSWYMWVEREPLNDLQLSDEGEAQFADDVGRVLGGNYKLKKVKFESYVPKADQKVLTQLVDGFHWLADHGFELLDHNGSQNWGVRADGSVALRDFGQIYVHRKAES